VLNCIEFVDGFASDSLGRAVFSLEIELVFERLQPVKELVVSAVSV
jgi:hypothetical protein